MKFLTSKIFQVLVITILFLAVVYLLILIFRVDIRYFTYSKKQCTEKILREKDDWQEVAVKKEGAQKIYRQYRVKFDGIDCQALSTEKNADYEAINNEFVSRVEQWKSQLGRGSNAFYFEILSERDLCEATHLVVTEVESDASQLCVRPGIFRQ